MSVNIVAENAKAGTYTFAEMRTTGYGDIAVAGFSRKPSVNVGERIDFCIDGSPSAIRIFRVGYYGGMGFREVATIPNVSFNQPNGVDIANSNGSKTSTTWSVTAFWNVPADAVSGMYMAMVRNAANDNAFYITFVVRDDAAQADIIYKTSDTTWGAAYNCYGSKTAVNGSNVYGTGAGLGNILLRSFAVSYHRPVITREGVQQTYWWACELPLIRFLERNGYTVKYVTSFDLDQVGQNLLRKGKIFLSSGHDEYWTMKMRRAVEHWRDEDAGHSLFMSGNEVFWKARYEVRNDEAIMWCYKDTMPGPGSHVAGIPIDPLEWTGTWKDTRWPQREPEWFLTGTDFGMNGVYDYDALIPSNPYGGHVVWGGSSLVDQPVNFVQVMGFEADHLHPTQPDASYKYLAAYTRAAPGGLSDANGENYNVPGNIVWGIVSQRYGSGAVTVGFGTCQWAWSLDDTHDRGVGAAGVSATAQQFTVNLLRDLGADPGTIMAGITLRPKNSLDEYGLDPTVDPPAINAQWFDSNIQGLTPYALHSNELVALTTTVIE